VSLKCSTSVDIVMRWRKQAKGTETRGWENQKQPLHEQQLIK